ncbi:MAG: lysoplasmalogenase [Acidobacteriota bacterium]|nr:lysoplasmalogenase [Acidobacteriota bacterium]
MTKWLWTAVFAGGILFPVGLVSGNPVLCALAKPVPVTAMIVLTALKPAGPYRNALLTGLVCSLVGDVFLVDKGDMFLQGLIYFLIAHLCYLAAFLTEERKPGLLWLLPFLIWGIAAFAYLNNHLGDLRVPVIVYMSAICIMMWRACLLIGKGNHGRSAAAGAVIFGLSDTLLAINHFAEPFSAAPYLVIILYWTGQGLLTKSVTR